MSRVSLPIDALLPDVVASLEKTPSLVLEAPPGAGKTTRVPAAMLEAGFARTGQVLALQPRRLPARLAADRVAHERGERVGDTVGYTIRYEDVGSERTRLRFLTEGVLTRRLLADPTLRGVSAVVIDEFHERHLASDLALGLLRQLQSGARPDLRVVVMSATLDAEPVAEYLGAAPRLRSEGRRFEVAVEHAAYPDDRPIAVQVSAAVRRLVQAPDGPEGDVLVFLPGAGEIRRCSEALEPLARARDLLVLPLHGDLPPAEQDRAVRRAARPKVILATNVAETSVTIDGVVAVVDAGLARLASHSPWTGFPTLRLGKISQAAAIQRAGRAGRTRPGVALRLYTKHDFESRRPFDSPEVERLDLAETVLALAGAGVRRPEDWGWFERPPGAAIAAAVALLRTLGATSADGVVTDTGREMLRFPVHPRLARLLVEAERRGVGQTAATVVALLGERDVRERSRVAFGVGAARSESAFDDADLFTLLDAFDRVRESGFDGATARSFGLDLRAVEAVERSRRQLSRMVRRESARAPTNAEAEAALQSAVLAAFPDRVARRRAGRSEVLLSAGGTASVGRSPSAEFMIAVDAEEQQGKTASAAIIRTAVPIEPELLLDGDDVASTRYLTESDSLVWNEATERVDRVVRLAYGAIALDESRRPAEPCDEASRILAANLSSHTTAAPIDREALERLSARLVLLREAIPEESTPTLGDDAVRDLLLEACHGRTSMAELRSVDLLAEWLNRQEGNLRERLRKDAPERIRLPTRDVEVRYARDRPPWIESRLQDFFGMATGPRVARGRVPLTLHLLAPNGRAVQVTSDLASFWKQHYPAIRRELARRYPRHAWPEDGATASTPPPKRPR